MIDSQALLAKQQDANKMSAKEIDAKRQQKVLDKQIKMAKKLELEKESDQVSKH